MPPTSQPFDHLPQELFFGTQGFGLACAVVALAALGLLTLTREDPSFRGKDGCMECRCNLVLLESLGVLVNVWNI